MVDLFNLESFKVLNKSELKFIIIIYSIPLICLIIKKFSLQNYQFIITLTILCSIYGKYQTLLLMMYGIVTSFFVYLLRYKKYKEQCIMLIAVNLLYLCHFYYKIFKNT